MKEHRNPVYSVKTGCISLHKSQKAKTDILGDNNSVRLALIILADFVI